MASIGTSLTPVWLEDDIHDDFHRWLLSATNDTGAANNGTIGDNDDDNNNNGDDDLFDEADHAQILRDTFVFYGYILLSLLIVFCIVRRRYKRPFTLRQWIDKIKSPLAEDQYGFFSWIRHLSYITDDELLEHCGVDAMCFLRACKMGFRLALIGCFNAIWLMPLYATAKVAKETEHIHDRIVEVTIGHVPSGSPRIVGCAIAAYSVFLGFMYLILHELEWFREQRHKFLRKPLARNYAVYVQNIPPELRSNAALSQYFKQCFPSGSSAVYEVRTAIHASGLASAIQQRDALVAKLENAIAMEEATGVPPTSKTLVVGGKDVDVITSTAEELKEANQDVKERIEQLDSIINGRPKRPAPSSNASNTETSLHPAEDEEVSSSGIAFGDDGEGGGGTGTTTDADNKSSSHGSEKFPFKVPTVITKHAYGAIHTAAQTAARTAVKTAQTAATAAQTAAHAAEHLLLTEDGEMKSAAFVSFTSLATANDARQRLHHPDPFVMEVFEAPDPDDVFWANVGLNHKELQLGKLFSMAATIGTCFLWTIPMTFFASLNSVEQLKEKVVFVEDMIRVAPIMEPILQLLAPFLVVIFNATLPMILGALSMREGPVSGAVVEASVFSKLAAFTIIQTFFISTISGALLKELSNIIDNPTDVVNLLATQLPSQFSYMLQITFVGLTLMIGMEILRVVPCVLAYLRRFVGPKLTEKQRETTYCGLRPFSDPAPLSHPDAMAQIVLFFMVALVYQVLAPLTAFVIAFCFALTGTCFRHQFVYIYGPNPDSGGKIWISLIKILCLCMLVAEVTVMGVMALKKATYATPLMLPLIITTSLFNGYIRQQHFAVTEYLPSRDSVNQDRKNKSLDLSFLKDAYVQPELRVKEAYPEPLDAARAQQLGLEPSAELQVKNVFPEPLDTAKSQRLGLEPFQRISV